MAGSVAAGTLCVHILHLGFYSVYEFCGTIPLAFFWEFRHGSGAGTVLGCTDSVQTGAPRKCACMVGFKRKKEEETKEREREDQHGETMANVKPFGAVTYCF